MSRIPAVFLDRDGVLTVERGHICPVDEVEIFPYAADCIAQIHKKGYLAIVITNQSGVARGLFTEKELLEFHEQLRKKTSVDAVYYCPHYVKGSVKKYAVECECRKPNTGLIKRACLDFKIDGMRSFMVGDRASDIITGKNAGLQTVLLESGYGSRTMEENVKADFVFQDLREFAENLKSERF